MRTRPYHSSTHGKIERYHQTAAIEQFVDWCNDERYHESLGNLKPMDVYEGRGREILSRRETIKRRTLEKRKRENLRKTGRNRPLQLTELHLSFQPNLSNKV